jgi:peptidoglycan/LPS O-acetylase OafA/YrhL
MKKSKYIKEIDSLRGISAIIIILSHFDYLNISSGGINIFFTISGYLITLIAFKNIENFNLISFLRDRILSTYAQIFLSVIGTLFLLFFFGDLDKHIQLLRSGLSSILLITNFYFIKINNLYSLQNYLNPYLIFWSIAVIFQFYFVFAVFLKLNIVLFNRFNIKLSEKNFLISISLLILISLLIILIFSDNKFINNFYSLNNRLWQFGFGSLIAIYFRSNLSKKYFLKKEYYIKIGLVGIIIWQFYFQNNYNYQIISLLLTFSTLLILIGLSFGYTNVLLSSKILIFVGKISLSIILIHVPLIYFANYYLDDNFVKFIFVIILTFVIAIPLQKMRYKSNINFSFTLNKKIIYSLLLLFIFFSSSVLFYYKNKQSITNFEYSFLEINNSKKFNYMSKLRSELNNKIDKNFKFSLLIGKDNSICFNNIDPFKNCLFNKNGMKQKIFFIGGSNGSTISSSLKDFFVQKGHPYMEITRRACLYLPEFTQINTNTGQNTSCDENFQKQITVEIENNPNSIVILTGRYQLFDNNSYFKDKKGNFEGKHFKLKFINKDEIIFREGLKKSIHELSKNNKVILIYPFPEFAENVTKKLIFFPEKKITTEYETYLERSINILKIFDEFNNNNVYKVRPDKFFCDSFVKNKCVANTNKFIFYEDTNHLERAGINIIRAKIIDQFKNIEF